MSWKTWMPIIFGLPLLWTGCSTRPMPAAAANVSDGIYAQYSSAVNDARTVNTAKIHHGLTAINESDHDLIWENGVVGSRLLVATVGTYPKYYICDNPSGCPGNTCKEGGECDYPYDNWVTVVPELKKFFTATPPSLLRLAQLMGLPPGYVSGAQKYVMEMWVSPGDLFRPCPDTEISDYACDTAFPIDRFRVLDTAQQIVVDTLPGKPFGTYTSWFNNRTRTVYQTSPPAGTHRWDDAYPWTRLGYTYDWGNPTHIGLSEFVLNRNRPLPARTSVGIKAVRTVEEYLSQ